MIVICPKLILSHLQDCTESRYMSIANCRSAAAADVNAYAEDRALWIARGCEVNQFRRVSLSENPIILDLMER